MLPACLFAQGTPAYTAPEVAVEGRLGKPADVYRWGGGGVPAPSMSGLYTHPQPLGQSCCSAYGRHCGVHGCAQTHLSHVSSCFFSCPYTQLWGGAAGAADGQDRGRRAPVHGRIDGTRGRWRHWRSGVGCARDGRPRGGCLVHRCALPGAFGGQRRQRTAGESRLLLEICALKLVLGMHSMCVLVWSEASGPSPLGAPCITYPISHTAAAVQVEMLSACLSPAPQDRPTFTQVGAWWPESVRQFGYANASLCNPRLVAHSVLCFCSSHPLSNLAIGHVCLVLCTQVMRVLGSVISDLARA